ncbi:nuclear transport factor 2 family protein [Streptomyces sp. NPDC058864]
MSADAADAPMRDVLARWKAAFDGRRLHVMAELFTPDALLQGSGPAVTFGRRALRGCHEHVPGHRTVHVGNVQGYRMGDHVAGGFAEVVFREPSGWEAPAHLSLALQREGGSWRISALVGRQPSGPASPTTLPSG